MTEYEVAFDIPDRRIDVAVYKGDTHITSFEAIQVPGRGEHVTIKSIRSEDCTLIVAEVHWEVGLYNEEQPRARIVLVEPLT